MNPRECDSVQELLSFRLPASQRLSELQKDTYLIIEDEDKEKEVKQTELANLSPKLNTSKNSLET